MAHYLQTTCRTDVEVCPAGSLGYKTGFILIGKVDGLDLSDLLDRINELPTTTTKTLDAWRIAVASLVYMASLKYGWKIANAGLFYTSEGINVLDSFNAKSLTLSGTLPVTSTIGEPPKFSKMPLTEDNIQTINWTIKGKPYYEAFEILDHYDLDPVGAFLGVVGDTKSGVFRAERLAFPAREKGGLMDILSHSSTNRSYRVYILG